MAINKVEYAGGVLMDLTSDTLVSTDQLVDGVVAHGASGELLTGTLKIVACYSGSDDPSTDIGTDGDIYLKV